MRASPPPTSFSNWRTIGVAVEEVQSSTSAPPNRMLAVAMAANEDEIKDAAEYFSSLKFKPWIRIIESPTVPRTRVEDMLVPLEGGEMEPIGQRIIEVPEISGGRSSEIQDPRSLRTFHPAGIKEGKLLVTTGTGWPSVGHLPRED